MSLPPRLLYEKGEFPAAAIGPSIDTSTNVPGSIMQGISITSKNGVRNAEIKAANVTTTTNLSQNKRGAPLMMAGQRQIDNTLKQKIAQDHQTLRAKFQEYNEDAPHLLVTQGRALHPQTGDQAGFSRNKRYASISVASPAQVLKKKGKFLENNQDDALEISTLSPEKQRVIALLDRQGVIHRSKNVSVGKQRQSLLIAYWQDMEEKRLKQESLSVKATASISGAQSYIERIRQRNSSKDQGRKLDEQTKTVELAELPESFQPHSYLKVRPVQLEESAIRKKCNPKLSLDEQNRADTMKQMQIRRNAQRKGPTSLSIDSKFTHSLNISAIPTASVRSTNSAFKRVPGKHESSLLPLMPPPPHGKPLNTSISEKDVHKSLELKREAQFKNMMASLADQIQNYGIRGTIDEVKETKTTFASLISSTLNLSSEQKEHLKALRKRELIQEQEQRQRLREEEEMRCLLERKTHSPQFIPIKLSHGTHYTVQKQLQHFNNTFSAQKQNLKMMQAKEGRMLVPFTKKMMMAGVNFHSQLCQLNPREHLHPQFSDLINISSLENGGITPLQETPSQETPTPAHRHYDRRMPAFYHNRPHLKRLGGGGTELIQGGALQIGGSTLQTPTQMATFGMIRQNNLGMPSSMRSENDDSPTISGTKVPVRPNAGSRMEQLKKFNELQKLFDQESLTKEEKEEEKKGLEAILQVKNSRQQSPGLQITVPRLESYSKAKRHQQRTKLLFEEAMAGLAAQDLIDNTPLSPPKPLITIVNSMQSSPAHIRSFSKNFKDSLMKLRETVAKEHQSDSKVPLDFQIESSRPEQVEKEKYGVNRYGNRYKILNKPPVRFNRNQSPTRRHTKGISPTCKSNKTRYKFPETGFGKAIDILNYQCMRFEMNPLEFEKDMLTNLNHMAPPEPTAAMIERLNDQEDLDSITTDAPYPRQLPSLDEFQPRNREYIHLRNEKLNVILRLANVFNAHVFRRKSGNPDINFVLKLSKVLGLKLTRNQLAKDPQIFKTNKEFAIQVKDRLTSTIHQAINESNGVIIERSPGHVKFYVNRGNNGMLVRSIMKKRYWWTMLDRQDVQECHVIWTQWRKNKIINKLKKSPHDQLRLINDSVSESTTTATTTHQSERRFSKRVLKNNNSSSDGEEIIPRMAQTLQKLKLDDKSEEMKEIVLEKEKSEKSPVKKFKEIIPEDAPPHLEMKIPHPTVYQSSAIKIYNRLENNFHISNKKAMFINLRNYYEATGRDIFDAVPVTFHIQDGTSDSEFQHFKDFYHGEEQRCRELESLLSAHKYARRKQLQQVVDSGSDSGDQEPSPVKRTKLKSRKNIWIVKPGENSNRGQGIHVCRSIQEISALINNYYQNKKGHTVIVQQYIDRPLLIHKRKFDIRCYSLVTSINGLTKGFAYNEGYIRTSSREFKLKNFKDKIIHLTNDAVQKKSDDYGKFEAANKISYAQFQKYIETTYPEKGISFYRHINTQIKRLITDTIRSVFGKMDPNKRLNCFEIFGYDFMVDQDFNVQLIEVNTNPDISLCCPLLAMLIPTMIDNAFRIAIDPLFPPPETASASANRAKHADLAQENKFQLIFDQRYDGQQIRELMKDRNGKLILMEVQIMDEESGEEDSSDDEVAGDDDE